MLTNGELQELRSRLQARICPHCIERSLDGTCYLWDLEECPITLHLERLVEITENVQSGRMDEYLERVREEICSVCQARLDPRHHCEVRAAGHCALDAYLPWIIETIEAFLAEKDHPALP